MCRDLTRVREIYISAALPSLNAEIAEQGMGLDFVRV